MPRRCPPPTVHATSGVTFLAWTGWCVNGEESDIYTVERMFPLWSHDCVHCMQPLRFMFHKPCWELRWMFQFEAVCGNWFLFSLLFRPLSATNTDKLDLQECLEHGRTAKVVVSLPVMCSLSIRPLGLTFPFLPSVREGEDHHHQVQFHQAGQGPALPRLHEREGGHTLVHWDREVNQRRLSREVSVAPPLMWFSLCLFLFPTFSPAGSSGSQSTTRTCPTWVDWRGRGCWAGRGACRSFATSLHPSKNTLPAFKRQL